MITIEPNLMKFTLLCLANALKHDEKNKTIRRVIIQDYIMEMNNRGLVPNEDVGEYLKYSYEALGDV